jgi:hypothetical protein
MDGTNDTSYSTIKINQSTANISSFTDGATPKCAADCHTDGGDWSRLWSTDADSASTAEGTARCNVCHGQYALTGWTDGTSHVANASRGDTQHDDGGDRNCDECHGYVTPGGNHENGSLTLSSNGGAPERSGNYAGCTGCHEGAGNNTHSFPISTFTTETVSGPGYAGGECISCHLIGGTGVGGTNNRRSVVGEFGLAWGHRNSGSDAVKNEDCGVCHMEGNPSTGSTDPTYHDNEEVELRNPDDGTIMYTFPTGVSMVRDVSSSTIETITDNVQTFCLACHDGGTIHANARTPWGSSTNPWNSVDAAAVNVSDDFSTSNASYHPVLGQQNNSYADSDTMLSPWNQTTKSAGSTNEWGDKITCFDCHNTANELTEGTAAAHGNGVTLRASVLVWDTDESGLTIATPLCVECHDTNVYWSSGGGTNSAYGTGQEDKTDTADATDSDGHAAGADSRMDKRMYASCQTCHGGALNATMGGRTKRAEATHGSDVLGNGNAAWGSGVKGYAFFRNTDVYGGSIGWQPADDGSGPYTPTCTPSIAASPECATGYHDTGGTNRGTWYPGGSF